MHLFFWHAPSVFCTSIMCNILASHRNTLPRTFLAYMLLPDPPYIVNRVFLTCFCLIRGYSIGLIRGEPVKAESKLDDESGVVQVIVTVVVIMSVKTA